MNFVSLTAIFIVLSFNKFSQEYIIIKLCLHFSDYIRIHTFWWSRLVLVA